MKAEQVDQALRQKFIGDGARIVFWNDPNGEFREYVNAGLPEALKSVTVVEEKQKGGLATKLLLEREDPTGKYLIYSVGEMPPPEEDWLLDIRIYSAQFHADVASIWLQELGLQELRLRDHLKQRTAFLSKAERRSKLKRFIAPGDTEATLDVKMMAVLTGSEIPTAFGILQTLCHRRFGGERYDLISPPSIMQTFEKMGLVDHFWDLMKADFGYVAPNPSIAGLLIRLFVSELLHQARSAKVDALQHFELPPKYRQNAVVFLTQWRDSSGKSTSYDATAASVAEELRISEHLGAMDADSLVDVYTFWEVEKKVVSHLRSRVQEEGLAIDVASVTKIATARQAGHWLHGPGSDQPQRCAVSDAYDAVVAAANLFSLLRKHQKALSFCDAMAFLTAYQEELFRFDQLYRRFCVKAKTATGQGWDLLKTLADEVERVYDQGFLTPLGLEWGRLLEDEGFLGTWRVSGLPAQQDFYSSIARNHLLQSDRRRAWVIISDAFRYEAAQELVEELNGRYRMDASLAAMLGVLPSYTALGMASLLPHQRLGYSDKGDVLVDGKTVASEDARNKQLATVGGMACSARELLQMTQKEAREFTRDKGVVYIYHNIIDARGDNTSTEGEAFAAVDDCIAELVQLVQFCVNRLNANNVWITADHGFLFQQEAPGTTDKSALAHKPEGAVKDKKRYVMGRNLGKTPEAHHGSTKVTAGTDDVMEFWIPRGANVFHFTGGARFVHGGAMPQEVLIPLVTVKELRGEKAVESMSKKVSVQVLGAQHKITTPKYRFELIQTEAVGERRKPLTLRAAVYDGSQAVTSIDTVTLDSASGSIDERKKSILLELRTGDYDKTKPYRLVLRDAETDAEMLSVPVVIDRSFSNDF